MLPKAGMVGSSVVLGTTGLCLLFAPDEISRTLDMASPHIDALLSLVGATYLGFAAGNWMARESALGGIYQRPLTMANLTHFFIGAMYFLKASLRSPSAMILAGALVYGLFAAFFVWLVFFTSAGEKRA